ncbi:hypothetical protein ACLGIH_20405 [Streptomyces sp. HMX87]|uniref:hypothetical protein n=1 Tax=Streptomyces sp. HMX87 TaxID=3390849 RepID=UPI003A848E48
MLGSNSVTKVIDRLQDAQGWTDNTVLDLLIRFVDEQGQAAELDEYLTRVANEENDTDEK